MPRKCSVINGDSADPGLSVWWQDSSSCITDAAQWGILWKGMAILRAQLEWRLWPSSSMPFLFENIHWNQTPCHVQLFLEFPPPPSLPRSWLSLSSSVSSKWFADLKKDLLSATLPDHKTCSVSPLFLSADHTTIRIDGMEISCSLQYLFIPAKTHPRDWLIHFKC